MHPSQKIISILRLEMPILVHFRTFYDEDTIDVKF